MNRKRILITACSVILVCLCAVVGAVYALFSDSVSVNNHLQAGNLDVTLKRTHLEYSVLNGNGELETVTDNSSLDLTSATDDNVFGIDGSDVRIVPGSYFEAEMKLENTGSAAFDYSVIIKLDGSVNALAEQLQVTVTRQGQEPVVKKLSELGDGLSIAVGKMSSDDAAQSFTVRIEFVSSDSNNDAQDLSASFDLVVEAIQATAQN